MTIKEKFFLGFSQLFRKRLEFDAQVKNPPGRLLSAHPNEVLVRGKLDLTDRVLDFPYALQQGTVVRNSEIQNRMYGFPGMETTLKEAGDELSHDYSEERRRLREHFLIRSRFVKGAHGRLTTMIRPRNQNIHTIAGLVARRRSSQIMNVEWQQGCHGMALNMSFSAFQSRSMEANGYQKREIRCLHFRKVNDAHPTFPGPPLDTATAKDYGANSSTEMFILDGVDGSISMVELDITDINGRKRRWICIEISKPLVQANGPVPSELIPMPRSYLKIAAPSDNVLVMTDMRDFDERPDLSQSPQLGDFKKLTIRGLGRGKNVNQVRLRMCSDGVPIFATGSKRSIPIASQIDDFLFAKNVTGLPWKETDRRVNNTTKALRKHEFWERYRSAAEVDKARWKSLQDVMARDDCVVDIEFGGEWYEVNPSVQAPQFICAPTVPLQTGLPPSAPSFRAQSAKKGCASSGSRRPGSSGLRNEVQL
ncbi:hypothetical protein CT0861_04630 [Colletotrichum tofieldiae]|uniref:Uncharacterized protein n=1 Tax=Colletotrichum tofieldiae TaxID=708197 RepID=A0A161VDW3_9PEZI|nr:hypothetical protein CT0861_04630 [Colletotrichum tofieldiae]